MRFSTGISFVAGDGRGENSPNFFIATIIGNGTKPDRKLCTLIYPNKMVHQTKNPVVQQYEYTHKHIKKHWKIIENKEGEGINLEHG